jgi:hypothetical protein
MDAFFKQYPVHIPFAIPAAWVMTPSIGTVFVVGINNFRRLKWFGVDSSTALKISSESLSRSGPAIFKLLFHTAGLAVATGATYSIVYKQLETHYYDSAPSIMTRSLMVRWLRIKKKKKN